MSSIGNYIHQSSGNLFVYNLDFGLVIIRLIVYGECYSKEWRDWVSNQKILIIRKFWFIFFGASFLYHFDFILMSDLPKYNIQMRGSFGSHINKFGLSVWSIKFQLS